MKVLLIHGSGPVSQFIKRELEGVSDIEFTCVDYHNYDPAVHCSTDVILSIENRKILNAKALSTATLAAINIHPGPPHLRGVGTYGRYKLTCARGDNLPFGFTIHLISEDIDSGRILEFVEIKDCEHLSLEELIKLTNSRVIEYLKRLMENQFSSALIDLLNKDNMYAWRGALFTRADLDASQIIKACPDCEQRFQSIIDAFHLEPFPTIIEVGNTKYKLTRVSE
ncbi:formyltransferase family protein [Planktomarina temperata]|nr:formyltransferase family protein [Planktomarina temperata]